MYTIATTCSFYESLYGKDDIMEDFSRKLIKECCEAGGVDLIPEQQTQQIIKGAKSYSDAMQDFISDFQEELNNPVHI